MSYPVINRISISTPPRLREYQGRKGRNDVRARGCDRREVWNTGRGQGMAVAVVNSQLPLVHAQVRPVNSLSWKREGLTGPSLL